VAVAEAVAVAVVRDNRCKKAVTVWSMRVDGDRSRRQKHGRDLQNGMRDIISGHAGARFEVWYTFCRNLRSSLSTKNYSCKGRRQRIIAFLPS